VTHWLEVRKRDDDGGGRAPWAWLLRVAVVLVAVWFGGFLQFVVALPTAVEEPGGRTDAIVVLTGGAERLNAGLQLLLAGQAGKLLISGVDPATTAEALQARSELAPGLFTCCVELGHQARDTPGNALETAMWVRRDGYRSLRVVTANYHMPRTLLLFRRLLPQVRLVANPVFPQHVKVDRWWLYPGSARLLATEFSKYLVSLIGVRLTDPELVV